MESRKLINDAIVKQFPSPQNPKHFLHASLLGVGDPTARVLDVPDQRVSRTGPRALRVLLGVTGVN